MLKSRLILSTPCARKIIARVSDTRLSTTSQLCFAVAGEAHDRSCISSARTAWQCSQEMRCDHLIQMPGRILPFADGVCAIRVRKHGERFIVLDQLIDQEFARLIVTIVVACTVDQE